MPREEEEPVFDIRSLCCAVVVVLLCSKQKYVVLLPTAYLTWDGNDQLAMRFTRESSPTDVLCASTWNEQFALLQGKLSAFPRFPHNWAPFVKTFEKLP